METNVVVLLMIGLPGSGKTTLCKRFISSVKEQTNLSDSFIVHVSYDDLIPLEQQEKFAKVKERSVQIEEESTWKCARNKVYSQVERFVEWVKGDLQDSDSLLKYFKLSKPQLEKGHSNYIILLDDNFYYRSMRYEYYQMARRLTLGYCQLYIKCSTDEALHRNQMRPLKVPVGVVEAMAKKLQPPLPEEHSWETNTLILQTDTLLDLSCIWDLVCKGFQCPVPPLEDLEDVRAEARLVCSKSVIHQADLHLRSLVTLIIKNAPSDVRLAGKKVSDISRDVNTGRQKILADMRSGSLHVPSHLVETVNDENKGELQSFLETELRKRIFE